MANDGEVLIPVNLQVKEAQKQADSLVKKLAKTKVDLKVNTAELEKADKEYQNWAKRVEAMKAVLDEAGTGQRDGTWVTKGVIPQKDLNLLVAEYEKAGNIAEAFYDKVQKIRAEQERLTQSASSTEAQYETLQKFVEELTPKDNSAHGAGIMSTVSDDVQKTVEAFRPLFDLLDRAEDVLRTVGQGFAELGRMAVSAGVKATMWLGKNFVSALGGMAKGIGRATVAFNPLVRMISALQPLIKRVVNLASRALIFNVISKGFRAMSTEIGNIIASNSALSSSLGALKGALLTAIEPFLTWAIPILISFINVLTRVAGAIASITAGWFGKSAKQAQANAKAYNQEAKAIGGVGKEASKTLASIDEINRLDASGGGGGGGGASPTFDNDFSFDLASKMQTLGGDIATAINNAIASVDWYGLGRKMGDFLALLIHVAWDFVTTMDWGQIGEAIAMLLNGAMSSLLSGQTPQEIAELLWGLMSMGLDILYGFLMTFDANKFVDGLLDIAKRISVQFANYMGQIDWAGLADRVYSFFYNAIANVDWWEIAKNILTGLAEGLWGLIQILWEAVKGVFNGFIALVKEILGIHSPSTVFADIGKAIMEGLVNGVKGMWETVRQLFINLWNTIKSVFATVRDWFRQTFNNGMTALSGAISGAVERVRQASQSVWNAIKGVFSTVGEWFRQTFQRAWENVKNVFSTGGQGFKGITDGITSTFKRIVNSLIGGINNVVAIPFNGINNALDRIRNISIAGMYPFYGRIPWISVPQIPYLAQGTVVPPNRQFMAMLGDNKTETEVVSPLSTMKEALVEALAESGGQHVVVNIDGRQLFDIVVNQNNSEVRRTGMTPLLT